MEFPGDPLVRTVGFHFRGTGFNPRLGNWVQPQVGELRSHKVSSAAENKSVDISVLQ